MLVIRGEQIKVLTRTMQARFEVEAYQHVMQHFPARCASLGEQAAIDWVRNGLNQAKAYGFSSQFDLFRYLNLLFECGQGFEPCALPYLDAASPLFHLHAESPTVRMDLLMDEAYRRLYPDQIPPTEPLEEQPTQEFDGIVWDQNGVEPSYVPQSIQPEYEPIVRPPAPGSVSPEEMANWDDEEDGEDGSEPEASEEIDGR